MGTTVFESRPLPDDLAGALRRRLTRAHGTEPFSTIDPRETVRRVAAILSELGVSAGVYRGGLDLAGIEVDHVWLAVEATTSPAYVVDAAFPLFASEFVATLRHFVAGDASDDELAAVAAAAGLEERVLGEYPTPMRYRGLPVWSQRRSTGAVPG